MPSWALALSLVPPAIAQVVDTEHCPAPTAYIVPANNNWAPYVAALANYRDRLHDHLDVSYRLGPDLFDDAELSHEVRESASTDLVRQLGEAGVDAAWCSEPCGRFIVDPSIVSVRLGPGVRLDASTICIYLTTSRWIDKNRGWFDNRNQEFWLRKEAGSWVVLRVRLESIN